jgi:hypothetical protein
MAVLLLALLPAAVVSYAEPAIDPKDAANPDFDIKTFGFKDDGKIFVQVYGKAARTLPTEDRQGFAYVFVTDGGVWAINGHQEPHASTLPEWHAERIFVDGNCVERIDVPTERTPIIAGNNAMVRVEGVTKIFSMQTVEFHLNTDEPDDPPEDLECVATVTAVFNTAPD